MAICMHQWKHAPITLFGLLQVLILTLLWYCISSLFTLYICFTACYNTNNVVIFDKLRSYIIHMYAVLQVLILAHLYFISSIHTICYSVRLETDTVTLCDDLSTYIRLTMTKLGTWRTSVLFSMTAGRNVEPSIDITSPPFTLKSSSLCNMYYVMFFYTKVFIYTKV